MLVSEWFVRLNTIAYCRKREISPFQGPIVLPHSTCRAGIPVETGPASIVGNLDIVVEKRLHISKSDKSLLFRGMVAIFEA